MLSRVTKLISNYLLKQKVICLEEMDVIIYALELLISTISYLLSIVIIACFAGVPSFGIVFIAFFMPIRAFCGGYHSSTYFHCFTATNFFFMCNLAIALNTPHHIQALLAPYLSIIASAGIFAFLPVINPKNPLSYKRICRDKKIGRVVIIIELICILLGNIFNYRIQYCYLASLSLITVYILMLIPIVSSIFANRNSDKNIK